MYIFFPAPKPHRKVEMLTGHGGRRDAIAIGPGPLLNDFFRFRFYCPSATAATDHNESRRESDKPSARSTAPDTAPAAVIVYLLLFLFSLALARPPLVHGWIALLFIRSPISLRLFIQQVDPNGFHFFDISENHSTGVDATG
jgi:hypothetical protein